MKIITSTIAIIICFINCSIAQIDTTPIGYIKYKKVKSTQNNINEFSFSFFTKNSDYIHYSQFEYKNLHQATLDLIKSSNQNENDANVYDNFYEIAKKINEKNKSITSYSIINTNSKIKTTVFKLENLNIKGCLVIDTLKPNVIKGVDTTNILGFKCYEGKLVINKIEYKIYYTNEISTIVGPNIYFGAPGAVLRVYLNPETYIEAVEYKSGNNILIPIPSLIPPPYKIVAKNDFGKLVQENNNAARKTAEMLIENEKKQNGQ